MEDVKQAPSESLILEGFLAPDRARPCPLFWRVSWPWTEHGHVPYFGGFPGPGQSTAMSLILEGFLALGRARPCPLFWRVSWPWTEHGHVPYFGGFPGPGQSTAMSLTAGSGSIMPAAYQLRATRMLTTIFAQTHMVEVSVSL